MLNTVVLDGLGQPVIGGTADLCVVTEMAEGIVEVLEDGTAEFQYTLDAEGSLALVMEGECGIVTKVPAGELPYYAGPAEVTPSRERQTLETADTILQQNITINPIPSCYGLITWNGSQLTVS